MNKIVGAPRGRFESPLFGKGGKDGFGTLIVIAEEMKGRNHDTLHLCMKGVALAAKDGILSGGKSGKNGHIVPDVSAFECSRASRCGRYFLSLTCCVIFCVTAQTRTSSSSL